MLKDIEGITKTVEPSRNTTEFTIHEKITGDMRLASGKHHSSREKILEFIKKAYFNEQGQNLPIYHVHTDNLK